MFPAYFQSLRRSTNRFIIYANCLAMGCVAANRGRPNTRNYGAVKAGESGVETETGRKRDEWNETATMKAGNVFDGH